LYFQSESVFGPQHRRCAPFNSASRGIFNVIIGSKQPQYCKLAQEKLYTLAQGKHQMFFLGPVGHNCVIVKYSQKQKQTSFKIQADAGLEVLSRVSVHGAEGKAALFRVWTMRLPPSAAAMEGTREAAARAAGKPTALIPWPWAEEVICVRSGGGQWTERYRELMEEMGIPTKGREAEVAVEPIS